MRRITLMGGIRMWPDCAYPSFPRRRESSEWAWRPLFSALRAAYFLLLRQKKVSKEKATPGLVSPSGIPCATPDWRGLRNSARRASNSPRPFSASPCVARHLARGPANHPGSTESFGFWHFSESTVAFLSSGDARFRDAFLVPLKGAEQCRRAGGSWRGLSEGRSPEFRSRPACRVAQGTGRSPAPTWGSPSFWLLFLGEARKSTPALKAENNASPKNSI